MPSTGWSNILAAALAKIKTPLDSICWSSTVLSATRMNELLALVASLPQHCSKPQPHCFRPPPELKINRAGDFFATTFSTLGPMFNYASLPDPDHAVVIRSLGKQFGDKVAVNGINLTIPAGSFYGVVGPNGAGKTTAMSMMTGLLRPDHGQVWVHGLNMWETPIEAKGILGVLVDGAVAFPRLTGAQLVTYSGLLRGMDADVVAERVPDLMRVMDLEESANKMVADYSAGMTKKISLAAAMIHSPKVLILDEPFEAVDPVSSTRIR